MSDDRDSFYEQNFVDNSQSPPQPQYETNSCELCRNDAHYCYDCPPHVPFVYNQDPCFNQDFDNIFPQTSPSFPQQYLVYGDEHLSTILETKSDEIIKSSVENLVLIPSESEGISDDTCDVPFYDNSPPLDVLTDHFELFFEFNDDCTSSDDDYFEDIDYVKESPPDSELVILEDVKDEILRAKLLNMHLLISKIESLNNNPTHDCVLKSPSSSFLSYTDNSSPEFETFSYHTEETSSGSTTTHANNSLSEYDSFLFKIELDQGELTSVVMNDIPDNSTNDSLIEEIDLFLALNNSIPPGAGRIYINSPSWNRPAFYDDDDDEYSIQVSEFLKKSPIAIAPVLPTEDPDNSLSMGTSILALFWKQNQMK
nr:hypothetical protein [Tanacetum cinerariifolium]